MKPKYILFALIICYCLLFSIQNVFSSEPFEATFNWGDSFQIYGWEPDPNIYGFDYYFTTEKVESSVAGHKIKVTSIEVSTPGTNLGQVINFDIEVHLSGTDITLPEGQFIKTNVNPISGYTKTAETKYFFVIGERYDTNSYIFSGMYDFSISSGSAYPYLSTIKTVSILK